MRALTLLALGLVSLAALPGLARAEDAPAHLLGTFRVTYYFVAEERGTGRWPLYAPACGAVLAHTSREFHHELSLEGTGRLRDGRLLNFSERCDCARPGHGGSRVCYEWLDRGEFPWGKGARLEGRDLPLRPFRSIAVDPSRIPVGAVIYIPAWRQGHWPDGSPRDGCLRAEDTGSRVLGWHVDVFVGRPEWASALQRDGAVSVRAYLNAPECAHWEGG